jgi:glycerate 2-kinase
MPIRTLLVAARAFDERLDARRVAAAVARGLRDGGWDADLCPIDADGPGSLRDLLHALHFDARMRSAHALIVCERELHEDTLAGSFAFETATRARQAGVPAYAITAHNRLDSFDARILDLQMILQARGASGLRNAAHKLAGLL